MVRAVAIFVLLVSPQFALAHGIGVQAKVRADTLVVEAYFEDDTPVKSAPVTIRDSENAIIAEGKTDEQGICKLAIPKPGKYRVRVDAGDGHIATTTITIGDDTPGAISDGPSRESYTGPTRYVLAVVGLLIIAGLTLLAMRATRKPAAK